MWKFLGFYFYESIISTFAGGGGWSLMMLVVSSWYCHRSLVAGIGGGGWWGCVEIFLKFILGNRNKRKQKIRIFN